MVLKVWSPDQERLQHLGNVLEIRDISPSQTYWIRNSGAGAQRAVI